MTSLYQIADRGHIQKKYRIEGYIYDSEKICMRVLEIILLLMPCGFTKYAFNCRYKVQTLNRLIWLSCIEKKATGEPIKS